MNIPKILAKSGVFAGWSGELPNDINDLTDKRINSSINWADGQTPITPQQIRDIVTVYVPPTQDEINDKILDNTLLNSRVLKALILALNDGSFVPGSNYTMAQIKNGIKNRL